MNFKAKRLNLYSSDINDLQFKAMLNNSTLNYFFNFEPYFCLLYRQI